MVGIRMIQKRRKRKYQLIPKLGTTSRLTVPGPHSHPSTPKLRPKRCVETSGDLWDTSQPPGSSLPVYGTPPTANGWYFHLALLSRNNHCRSVTFPMRIEPRGHDKAGRNPGGGGGGGALEIYPRPSHHPTTPRILPHTRLVSF